VIDKKAIKESEKLYKSYSEAKKIDNSKQISIAEEKIWGLHQAREKELCLHHAQEAEGLKIKIDNLKAHIISLNSTRQEAMTKALFELKSFNRPHIKNLTRRLERTYESLERKKFKEMANIADTQFFGRTLTFRTNLQAITKTQLRISEIVEDFSNNEEKPLGEFVKKVEDIEQTQPIEFRATTIYLHEREALNFDDFIIPPEKLNNPDFRITILPTEILRQRISTMDFLSRPRKIKAA
jgi:hypothetical protein